MKKKAKLPVPAISALRKLGADIKEARLRRRITMSILAERAGISRITMARVERGDSSTSIGAYVAVLFSLGLNERLSDIADTRYDLAGQRIIHENLPQRARIPGSGKKNNE